MMIATPPADPIPSLNTALDHKQVHVRQRARIILMTLDGKDEDRIAEAVGVSKRTVAKWQNAWDQDGLWIFPADVFTKHVPDSTSAGQHTDAVQEATTVETVDTQHEEPEAVTNAPEATLPPRVELDPEFDLTLLASDSMGEAGRKLMLRQLEALLKWEAVAVEGEDIEGVHKMRVATRRTRNILEVFVRFIDMDAYKTVRKRLAKTAKRLGDVRDLDVFRVTAQHYIDTELDGDGSALQPMFNELDTMYGKARKRLMRWLSNKDYDSFVQDFAARLQNGKLKFEADMYTYRVEQMVPRLIYTYLEYVRLHEPLLQDASVEMLHELRLDMKRLRYVLEFFADVLGDDVQTVITETKTLQDYLGDLNDHDVAANIIRELSGNLSGDDKAAAKAFRKYCQQRVETLRANASDAWAAFDSTHTRQALGHAVGSL